MPQKSDKSLSKSDKTLQESFNKKLEDIQKAFNEAIENLKKSFEDDLSHIQEKIAKQELEIEGLKSKNKTLEIKMDDIEQKQISNFIVLNGSLIQNALKEVPKEVTSKPKHAVESVLLNELNFPPEKLKILKAYKMPKKVAENATETNNNPTPIVIVAKNNEVKNCIFKTIIDSKRRDIFVNELLTKRRRGIIKKLLETRKKSKKYLQVYSYDGVIHVRKEKKGKAERIENTNDMEKVILYLTEVNIKT